MRSGGVFAMHATPTPAPQTNVTVFANQSTELLGVDVRFSRAGTTRALTWQGLSEHIGDVPAFMFSAPPVDSTGHKL